MNNLYLHIITERFQKTVNEEAEIVNEGMYGKAISEFLKNKLTDLGYKVPFICNEDWGWWIEIKGYDHVMGLCVYGRADEDNIIREYVIMSGVSESRKWSWKRLRFVDASTTVNNIMNATETIIKTESDVIKVTRMNEMPW